MCLKIDSFKPVQVDEDPKAATLGQFIKCGLQRLFPASDISYCRRATEVSDDQTGIGMPGSIGNNGVVHQGKLPLTAISAKAARINQQPERLKCLKDLPARYRHVNYCFQA